MINFASETLEKLRQSNVTHKELSPVIDRQTADFSLWEEWKPLCDMMNFFGQNNPYDAPRDGQAEAVISIQGKSLASFCTYNYLGLNGHPEVISASNSAASQFGTSASASRIAGGECAIHKQFEDEIANFFECESAATTVGGYVANVAVIGFLADKEDLIIFDEFCHNSIVAGCSNSAARRVQFRHQDIDHLETLLQEQRNKYRRVLIIVESVYSMDGDIANLPRLVALKERFGAILMVDEAHSLGVLGATGRGLAEHYGMPCSSIDVLMSTLSKSFASCGGIIMGSRALTQMLKYKAKGFQLYSAGIPPTAVAAAQSALHILAREPERVIRLQQNAAYLMAAMKSKNVNVGLCEGTPIIPVMVGKNHQTTEQMAELTRQFFRRGIHVIGLSYPVVPRNEARLRFFVSVNHTHEILDDAVDIAAELLQES